MTEHEPNVTDPSIQTTTSTLTRADRMDHWRVRWGIRREDHRVAPGLYALGNPTPDSPVFVTANYTLSFDALRSSLPGIDGYILVLDTKGVNVWCAAGKGTFGTDEVVHRVETTGLADVVRHRTLILPQLGAPGVAAHDVRRRTGFRVEFGPVRAADLPAYLEISEATPEMRRVHFDLRDRVVLIPVELVHVALPTLAAIIVLGLLGGPLVAGAGLAAVMGGVALFPILLPWLPTIEFSTKGLILGTAIALPFVLGALLGGASGGGWLRAGWALAFLLAMPPVTAYLALNFTGSTPITSRSGVRREIFVYIRPMGAAFAVGVLLALAAGITNLIGRFS